jgi:hypothetical protein
MRSHNGRSTSFTPTIQYVVSLEMFPVNCSARRGPCSPAAGQCLLRLPQRSQPQSMRDSLDEASTTDPGTRGRQDEPDVVVP